MTASTNVEPPGSASDRTEKLDVTPRTFLQNLSSYSPRRASSEVQPEAAAAWSYICRRTASDRG